MDASHVEAVDLARVFVPAQVQRRWLTNMHLEDRGVVDETIKPARERHTLSFPGNLSADRRKGLGWQLNGEEEQRLVAGHDELERKTSSSPLRSLLT